MKLVLNFVELPQEASQIKRSPATFYLNSFLWKVLEASFELRGASTKGFQKKRGPATYYLNSFLWKFIEASFETSWSFRKNGFQIKRDPATYYLNSFLWKFIEASFELRGASAKRISNKT